RRPGPPAHARAADRLACAAPARVHRRRGGRARHAAALPHASEGVAGARAMRTLVHLSDLHFGRLDARLLPPLTALVNRLEPDLVAISGDLTQRAKPEQFAQARAWLDTLPAPKVVVPGNHDIPLY